MNYLRSFFALGLILFLVSSLRAQDTEATVSGEVADDWRPPALSEKGVRTGGFSVVERNKKIEGSFYFSEEWNEGKVFFHDGGVVENQLLRYDMRLSELEFKTDDGIKVASPEMVARFKWTDKTGSQEMVFLSAARFKFNDEVRKGFFKLLADGKCKALEFPDYSILKANFDVVTNTGYKNDRVIKKSDFYIEKDGVVYELSKRTRKNLKLFGDKRAEVKAYIKSENLSFKQAGDIAKIVTYYNELN